MMQKGKGKKGPPDPPPPPPPPARSSRRRVPWAEFEDSGWNDPDYIEWAVEIMMKNMPTKDDKWKPFRQRPILDHSTARSSTDVPPRNNQPELKPGNIAAEDRVEIDMWINEQIQLNMIHEQDEGHNEEGDSVAGSEVHTQPAPQGCRHPTSTGRAGIYFAEGEESSKALGKRGNMPRPSGNHDDDDEKPSKDKSGKTGGAGEHGGVEIPKPPAKPSKEAWSTAKAHDKSIPSAYSTGKHK